MGGEFVIGGKGFAEGLHPEPLELLRRGGRLPRKSAFRTGKSGEAVQLSGMSKKKPADPGKAVYGILGAVVPSCGPALKMVERGQERPLKLRERFVLAYNTPLCLHCNCKREKFEKERAKLREIQAARKG